MDGDAWDAHHLNGEALCPMQQPHQSPTGDGRPEHDPSSTLALWYQRALERNEELRAQLATAIEANAALHRDVVMWQRLAARQAGLDDLPPLDDGYLRALRTPQHEPYREVHVTIDGRPCVVGLRRARPADPDAAYVLSQWRQLVGTVRQVYAPRAAEA